MRKLDEACAWLIFLAGVGHIVFLEIFGWRGGVLDTGLLYIFVAMFNLLRIRNHEVMRLLMVFCLGANVAALILEIARWNMWMRWYTVAQSLHFAVAIKSLTVLILLSLQTVGSMIDFLHHRKLRVPAIADRSTVPVPKAES